MYIIKKEFHFSYGHRVHSQVLNTELSVDSRCVCRHQHGHNGKIIVSLSAEDLNNQGMVIDFKELEFFKVWLDTVLDHKMILDINDPANNTFYPLLKNHRDELIRFSDEQYYLVDTKLYNLLPDYEREIYEGLVLVDFVPTSENLSKWIYDILQNRLGKYCQVLTIEFSETIKTSATYG